MATMKSVFFSVAHGRKIAGLASQKLQETSGIVHLPAVLHRQDGLQNQAALFESEAEQLG